MGNKDTDSRLSGVPIFRELSKKELRSVGRLMTEVNIREGTTLIEQDTIGREFMIILEGTAVVRRNGRKVASLGTGDIMGELSMLSGEPRTATVIATSDLVVETFNRREFMSLLDQSPRMSKKILLRAITSLHQLVSNHVA